MHQKETPESVSKPASMETVEERLQRTGQVYSARDIEDARTIRREMGTLANYDDRNKAYWFGKGTNYETPVPNDGKITLYRATPTGEPISPGNYVTQSKKYAEQHIEDNLGGIGSITSIEATLNDIAPADAPNEFWYTPGWIEDGTPDA